MAESVLAIANTRLVNADADLAAVRERLGITEETTETAGETAEVGETAEGGEAAPAADLAG